MQPDKQDLIIPTPISESLNQFRIDYPDPQRVAFIMMRFKTTGKHQQIYQAIKDALWIYGITAVRADDKDYNTDLYANILTYVYGSAFGVAVFEGIEQVVFNTNIAYEVGFMQALGKRVCLLKEQKLQTLNTDLCGKLYHTFDEDNIKKSIKEALQRWLKDQDLHLVKESISNWIKILENQSIYKNWCFRINWPIADIRPKVDAYSKRTNLREFFEMLFSPSLRVTTQELASVHDAMKRAAAQPVLPKKLSGDIVFAETSRAVLEGMKGLLTSTPYERPKERHSEWKDALQKSEDLFPPPEFFCNRTNNMHYQMAQKKLPQIASLICKNVLCSTYQISLSQALYWRKSGIRKPILAMACTARNSKKENISVVSQIPVVMKLNRSDFSWYGQLENMPTTEYQSHWRCHENLFERSIPEHILIHFHSVPLLEHFDALQIKFKGKIPLKVWRTAERIAQEKIGGIRFRVFDDFIDIGARDLEFGMFVARTIPDEQHDLLPSVVWKPDHGLWLAVRSDSSLESIRSFIEKVEEFSVLAAEEIVRGKIRKSTK